MTIEIRRSRPGEETVVSRLLAEVWHATHDTRLGYGKVVEITNLADAKFAIAMEDVQAFLKKDEEPGYVECSNKVLAHFLDGLVFYRRGRDESLPPRPVEKRVTRLRSWCTAPIPPATASRGLAKCTAVPLSLTSPLSG